MDKPDKLDIELIVSTVANGGSLIDLCQTVGARYSDAILWILEDQSRKEVYNASIKARGEWFIQNILMELNRVINVDIRQAFNEAGGLKNIQELPTDVAKAIASVEISEIWQRQGKDTIQIGELKKVKFWNKLPALEMLGKNLKMFVERHELTASATLEQLVAQSNSKPQEATTNGKDNGSSPTGG